MTTAHFNGLARRSLSLGGRRGALRADHLLFAALVAASFCAPRVGAHVATLTPFGFGLASPFHSMTLHGGDRRGRGKPTLRRRLEREFDDLITIADAFLSDPFAAHHDASPRHGEVSGGNRTQSLKLRRAADPAFEWEACEGGMVLHAATPGLRKEDLSIRIVDEGAHRYLIVSGETKDPAAAEGGTKGDDKDTTGTKDGNAPSAKHHHKGGYYYEKFEHRTQLPNGVTGDCLAAKYEDGMLTLHLRLPQEKQLQTETIAIA
eukprot:CAMPEP_0174921558 /NCGR_PEP_ID=MMETSP1355-20121228/5224_1 /TAXON_ID=464990 /ORGANISM="Hemiselmis tepida, Strain CCMP443" /LENGTH=261 /DNA_ID=CAMNT_0016167055 /DNA_START=101 /DNA_END=886 /DNA_ORIENTATION=-